MRISDWSSDVCSSDLVAGYRRADGPRVGRGKAGQGRLSLYPARPARAERGGDDGEVGGLLQLPRPHRSADDARDPGGAARLHRLTRRRRAPEVRRAPELGTGAWRHEEGDSVSRLVAESKLTK